MPLSDQQNNHELRMILYDKVRHEPSFALLIQVFDNLETTNPNKSVRDLLNMISKGIDRRGRQTIDKLREVEVERMKLAIAHVKNLDDFMGTPRGRDALAAAQALPWHEARALAQLLVTTVRIEPTSPF